MNVGWNSYISFAAERVVLDAHSGGADRVAVTRATPVRVSRVRPGGAPVAVLAKLTVRPHRIVLSTTMSNSIICLLCDYLCRFDLEINSNI